MSSGVTFNGNNQGSGGGGGGDATAANQVLEIAQLQSLLLELQSFANQNNVDLTAVISQLNGSISSTNVLAKEASFQKLIQVNGAAGFTNLYDLLVALTNINTGKATAANQVSTNGYLSAFGVNMNTMTQCLQMLSGSGGLASQRSNTNTVNTIIVNYSGGVRMQQSTLTIQIEPNAGATGTLNIEVQVNSLSPYITIPLIDLQATFIGSYVNPPYNVAGSKIYQLAINGVYSVRITPSVLNTSYFYSVIVSN